MPMPSGFVSAAEASGVTPVYAMRQLRVLICPASRQSVSALRGCVPLTISFWVAHESATLSPGPPRATGPADTSHESVTEPSHSFQPPFSLSVVNANWRNAYQTEVPGGTCCTPVVTPMEARSKLAIVVSIVIAAPAKSPPEL